MPERPTAAAVYSIGDSISFHYREYLPLCLKGLFGGEEIALGGWTQQDTAEIGGCDSSHVLTFLQKRLPYLVEAGQIKWLLLNCGLHDLKRDRQTGAHQIPLADYARNLERILACCAARSVNVAWVRTTPLCVDPKTQAVSLRGGYANAGFDRLASDLAEYNAAADGVMAAAHISVADLYGFTTALCSDDPAVGTYDGVHFTPDIRRAQASFLAGWISGRIIDNSISHQLSPPSSSSILAYTAPVSCVALPENQILSSDTIGSVIPAIYGRSPVLPLYQWWLHPWKLPDEHAKARCGFTTTHLCFYLYMVDSDVISYSTANNEKMWQLGDCIEVFVKPEDGMRTDYWEIHLTPNGHFMDIWIPQRGDGSTWEQQVAAESGAEYAVGLMDRGWAAELRIPWTAFGLDAPPAAGTVWRINVGRYNAVSSQRLREDGTIDGRCENSASAPLSDSDFHHYEEFNSLVFGPSDPDWSFHDGPNKDGFVPDTIDLRPKL